MPHHAHSGFTLLISDAAQGRTFEVPERVPFRLTHNIIDGMGVTGVEGTFYSAQTTIDGAEAHGTVCRRLSTIRRDHASHSAGKQRQSPLRSRDFPARSAG